MLTFASVFDRALGCRETVAAKLEAFKCKVDLNNYLGMQYMAIFKM